MPSISFMDSRQRSKATSTHASNLLRQQSILSPAAIAAPELTNTNTRTTASSRSSEEVMSSASSPDSSAEDSDDDDILEDDGDELEKADSGYGRSYNNVKQEHTSANMAVPPPAMGERRTSFGTATALMGRMGLGSLPLRSPVSGQDASLASTSPYGASSLSVGMPVVNYSTSPNYRHSTPLGTSPHLPMPSSSLRGGAVHEEDEDEEEDGDEDGDEEMERSQKEGSKGSEEEGDWNTMDMEM